MAELECRGSCLVTVHFEACSRPVGPKTPFTREAKGHSRRLHESSMPNRGSEGFLKSLRRSDRIQRPSDCGIG